MNEHKLPREAIDTRLRTHNGTIESELRGMGRKLQRNGDGGWHCQCPFHDDKNASFDVYRHQSRNVDYFKCKACDAEGDLIEWMMRRDNITFKQAVAQLGGDEPKPARRPPPAKPKVEVHRPTLVPVTLIPPRPLEPFDYWKKDKNDPGRFIERKGRKVSTVHPMIDRDGVLQGFTGRIEWNDKADKAHKVVLPFRQGEDGKWYCLGWQHPDRSFLYGEHRLAQRPGAMVAVFEGERKADTWNIIPELEDQRVGVSWIGGATSVQNFDWSQLQGRSVLLWPDNDEPGHKAMDWLQAHLLEEVGAASVYRVFPPEDKPAKWDIVDLLDETRGQPFAETVAVFLRDHARNVDKDWLAKQEAKLNRATASQNQFDWMGDNRWVENRDRTINLVSEVNLYNQLKLDPQFKGRFQFDVFTQERLVDGAVQPHCFDLLNELAQGQPGLTPKSFVLEKIVEGISLEPENRVNRFADALRRLTWDGEPRLQASLLNGGSQGLLPNYADVESTPFTRIAGMRWMIGLVKRVLQPLDIKDGVKHDLVLVLEGAQGHKKTSFFEILGRAAGHNVYASMVSSSMGKDKDDMGNLRGKAIIELPELVAHKKADQDAFKAFVDRRFDTYRRVYGRASDDFPRFCAFAGSTNQLSDYLTDNTGNRRMLPARVRNRIDTVRLAADVEQIWAEAVYLAQAGEQHWLTDEEEAWQKEALASREIVDPWTGQVEFSLQGKAEIPVKEVIRLMPELQPRERNNAAVQRIVQILHGLGWEKVRAPKRGGEPRPWVWVKP